ncbi:glutamine-hydrolyzing carbamoyl-phosphate synthase small subunit [Methylomonas methanica]|uniref:Carbamoyl phosphate synthase small chain n=1 Tax=Methylomonas methanica (strain DSM 25384 / MC09) TaxID=857087 RepID=G0A5G2_METMM|nr:glutamine-hydrolyzing carbamoyl-phosphate synthase small subunit [Methylomonas methanica]AEG01668.1 carbamoyl-phosphate synthase, small subunit [Methylomonas methanica MC09]
MNKPALLVLEDGTEFHGISIGADGCSVGEVVFNTALTGYQEILSDPSYARQIVTLTYPHIGNVGTNSEDDESAGVFASGLVVRDLPLLACNWRSEKTLPEYLWENKVVAIADIDTRKLTRLLRDKGAQRGCIMAGERIDLEAAKRAIDDFPGLQGLDLAREVTTSCRYEWTESVWKLGEGHAEVADLPKHVVAYDFGVKRNILRLLVSRGCRVTVVPATTPAEEVLAMNPDGVFLSNGPGDPEPCDYAIAAIKTILERKIPVFGICLGHQLLALASGAKTCKMKFGHHGANHPVQHKDSGRVMISSQNHGFAVSAESLPANLRATYHSLFDGSLQGIERTDCPAFSFQGHPEASPGPHDVEALFDDFVALMNQSRTA